MRKKNKNGIVKEKDLIRRSRVLVKRFFVFLFVMAILSMTALVLYAISDKTPENVGYYNIISNMIFLSIAGVLTLLTCQLVSIAVKVDIIRKAEELADENYLYIAESLEKKVEKIQFSNLREEEEKYEGV